MCVEGLELYATIHRTPEWHWRKPIPQGLAAFTMSVLIRVLVGAAVAAAAAGSGQVSGSLAAFGLGVAAPLIIEKLTRYIPLTGPELPSDVGKGSAAGLDSAKRRQPDGISARETLTEHADPVTQATERHPGAE